MHRIDTVDEKGAPTYDVDEKGRHLFRSGNPHREEEVLATRLDHRWFNAVQEELCTFMESQGIPLKEGDYSGLTQAVSKIIDAKLTPLREEIEKIWTEIGK